MSRWGGGGYQVVAQVLGYCGWWWGGVCRCQGGVEAEGVSTGGGAGLRVSGPEGWGGGRWGVGVVVEVFVREGGVEGAGGLGVSSCVAKRVGLRVSGPGWGGGG